MYHWHGQYPITFGRVVSGNTKELYPLQPGKVCLVVFSSSSRVGTSAVNILVGESRVTAHVRSIAHDDLYSSVVVKTTPPGFNFPDEIFYVRSLAMGRTLLDFVISTNPSKRYLSSYVVSMHFW